MTVGRFMSIHGRVLYEKVGETVVYSGVTTSGNRRAIPATCVKGSIVSVSIYHNGGTGNLLLGVYSDSGGTPDTLLGVTASTPINAIEGWQELQLLVPVAVIESQPVWLAWVFETNPGIRYAVTAINRAQSSDLWAGGMPSSFGSATYASNTYSVFCNIKSITIY